MKGKNGNVGLILMLFVALLLPSRSMAQFRMWQGGLFGMGPLPEELEEEEYFENVGYRGGLFNRNYYGYGGYNLYNQLFGSDVLGGYELYNQTFGQENEEAPLGSGLLIMTAAGAGYALKKRKNNKKQKS